MVRVVSVSHSYKTPYSSHPVLADVNFEINAGETVLIYGQNGSGKSTLAKIIAGLITPDEGQVCINDISVTGEESRRKINLGYLFQHYHMQVLGETVFKDIWLSLNSGNLSTEKKSKLVDETIELFGLQRIRNRKIGELSGGELKKTALASLLIANPEYLLLDEPFSMLDNQTCRSLLSILKRFKLDVNSSIILFAHRIEAVDLVDRVISINNGKISA